MRRAGRITTDRNPLTPVSHRCRSAGLGPRWWRGRQLPAPASKLGDVFRLQALWSLNHRELDLLAFVQRAVAVTLD